MSEAETRSCASCQSSFVIEPEDLAFYAKMEVPAPTWCPSCRFQRRLAFSNEWHVFKKPDAKDGSLAFSSISPTSKAKIYANDDWFSDSWDPLSYGREYDFTRPFFAQFKELFYQVPLQARAATNLENSDYCIMAAWLKNCYLVSTSDYTQDSAYMVFDANSKNCYDTLQTEDCELCYGSVNLQQCYQTFFSVDCINSRSVILSKGLVGCGDCFGSVNLRNKQYYIFNQPHTKEEYESKIKEFALGSHQSLERLTAQAHDLWLQYPEKYMQGRNNEDVSGEYVTNSKNAQHCYKVWGAEGCKYVQNISLKPCKESYDYTCWGNSAELMYESVVCGENVYNCKFNHNCLENVRNVQYSTYCVGASDLFGCVSLRKKQYCILNQQYTKEEYEALVPKIIEHMNQMPYVDAKGREYRYGEFFPAELSQYEYNVSVANEYFPLSKEQALAEGYRWYDQPERTTSIAHQASDLPDSIDQVDPAIAGKVIGCAHAGTCEHGCTKAFTTIPQELAYLLEQKLPLPRLCFACRHAERVTYRRPATLQTRQCDCQGSHSAQRAHQYINTNADHGPHAASEACPNQFETSFGANSPQIVYCESCYQAEVI